MRYVLLVLLALLLGFAAWLAFAPAPIDPVAWTPPANPGLTGPYAANEALKGATLASIVPGHGPEDVAQGPDGLLYTGLEDGSIVRLKADGSTPPRAEGRRVRKALRGYAPCRASPLLSTHRRARAVTGPRPLSRPASWVSSRSCRELCAR